MKYLLAAKGTQACGTARFCRIRPRKRPGGDSRPTRAPDAVAVSALGWAHGARLARTAFSPPTARRVTSSLARP